MAAIGGDDLDSVAGLLAQRGSHGRTWTLLIGNDLESLLAVTSPEPGGSSASEVSSTVPDEPMLPSHVVPDLGPHEFAKHVHRYDSRQDRLTSWVSLFPE
jgi:hypothetical protein